ncbi:outer membrane protein assembly factor BamB family protein [Haladaptatus sp. NG-SE-30]
MARTHRREFLKAVGILGATATVGAEFAHTVTGTGESTGPWTTFRGNAGRTGATTDSGPGSNVTTDWSFDMGGEMYGVEPVVGDGTLYLAVTTANSPSVNEGYVAAYDPTTGDERWKRDDISAPATPTVGNGTVYFDTGGSEFAGSTGFFAVDSETGETKWHKEPSSGVGDPLVADGRLYSKIAGNACELDPETGEDVWKTDDISGGACYAEGTLFYGGGVALSADDGSVRWDISGDDDELQTVADGLVFGVVNESGGDAVVKARSTADGAVQWSYSLGNERYWWADRLTVAGGRVFFRINSTIRALDATTGEEAWTYEADAELAGALTVADGTLLTGGRTNPESDSGDAIVVAIDAASGEHRWDYIFGSWEFEDYGPAANTPVVADGRVFTATFPKGSTIDWEYTEYGDFHVLRADETTETTTETTSEETTTETTSEETTTETTSEETTTETTSEETTTKTTTEATDTTETTKTATETTTATTKSSEKSTERTTTVTTWTEAPGTNTTETTGSAGGEMGTTTTATDGQPGFGILTTVGGLAGVGAYLRNRLEDD